MTANKNKWICYCKLQNHLWAKFLLRFGGKQRQKLLIYGNIVKLDVCSDIHIDKQNQFRLSELAMNKT